MSLLYDLLWGSPPDEHRREGAPVKTGVDGSMYIDAKDLLDEKAFKRQVRHFARPQSDDDE